MGANKTGWDVLSEFGRIGILTLSGVFLILWGVIHYVAKPGETISFAFWSYTKAVDNEANADLVYQQLAVVFSFFGVSVSYGEDPCSEIRVHDADRRVSQFDIRNRDLYLDIESDTPKIILEATAKPITLRISDDIAYWDDVELQTMILKNVFQNVKTQCLGGKVEPITIYMQ